MFFSVARIMQTPVELLVQWQNYNHEIEEAGSFHENFRAI